MVCKMESAIQDQIPAEAVYFHFKKSINPFFHLLLVKK